jgi:hypothetical protein
LPEYEQKDEFKKFLNASRKKSDEENYDEADNKAFFVTNRTEVRVPSNHAGLELMSRSRPTFRICCRKRALRTFPPG